MKMNLIKFGVFLGIILNFFLITKGWADFEETKSSGDLDFLATNWSHIVFVLITLTVFSIIYKIKSSWKDKELEKQKVMMQKIEKMADMKAGFLANISNELRTPLNGIIEICESFNEGAYGKLPEKAKSNITIVSNSSKRLLKMADDILDLSVMSKGDFTIKTDTLNLRTILDDSLLTLNTLAQGKNLKLIDNVDRALPLIKADPQRIQQVIFNVVGNSIKYTSEGKIEIGAKVEGNFIEFYVKDTGEGIEKEKLDNIFKEFVHDKKSKAKQKKGTGLGLPIAKNLINLMGGDMSIESVTGEGSICKFTLPISTNEEAKDISSDQFSDNSQYILNIQDDQLGKTSTKESQKWSINPTKYGYKILIVNDNNKDRFDLTNLFVSDINFSVLSATNGVEAIRMVETEDEIDLVIIEADLPMVSGIEATRRIRNKFGHYELPVVMLAKEYDNAEALEGFDAGVNDYIVRPFDEEILKIRCKNLLGLRRAVRVALEKTKSLKDEKQKRMFSEMLTQVAGEVSKTLNTSKALSLVTSRIQEYFGFEKSVGCIILENGIKFIGVETKEERDEVLANYLENTDKFYIKELVDFAINQNYFEHIEKIKREGIKSNRPWIHFPIVYNDKLHGLVSVCEYKYLPLEETGVNVIKAIIGHVAAFVENSKLYGRVKTLATVDGLTGLINRRHFFEKANKERVVALKNNYKYNIIMMDIDNFKSINDTYGHGIGDDTLRKIGKVLKSVANKNILLGRFGGEEFIVGFAGGKEAYDLAEKIRKKVAASQIDLGDNEKLNVTVSVGLSTSLPKDKSIDEIIKRADENLYKAKKSGKNRVIYDEAEYN